ncbi:accessory Sec system protein Asp2 [Aerococcus viridans]|uniref:accessory Sec system protein Asp2 n=1 Tax=Aerococcus viridans TaxID=1377 RepID=UPI0038022F0A
MEKKLHILQIGRERWELWNEDGLIWYYIDACDDVDAQQEKLYAVLNANEDNEEEDHQKKLASFDAVIISELSTNFDFSYLQQYIEPYTILVNQELSDTFINHFPIFKYLFVNYIDMQDIASVIATVKRDFFIGQNGTKLHVKNTVVNQVDNFNIYYNGNNYVEISEINQSDYVQLLYWNYNIGLGSDATTDLWLEYDADNQIDLRLVLHFIDSAGEVTRRTFTQIEMEHYINVNVEKFTYLAVSIEVKGQGIVKVGPLHYRKSREQYGEMLLGGQVGQDSQRKEFFYYFNPGDLQPPLNVYFSGYRTAEGFEGYWMMKNLGKPFLLISDPRLEGGRFYIGSVEYEQKIENVIQTYLDLLSFSTKQLVVSGLSMGTYGAIYYGARLEARAIVVGKPLINLGDIARNVPLHRPEAFETSLDLVNEFIDQGEDRYEKLNNKIVPYLEKAKFPEDSTIAIAYMMQDDYDSQAYFDLLNYLSEKDINIISKGLVGRHNDNSPGINQWFFAQLKRLNTSIG